MPTATNEFYQTLEKQLRALLSGERNPITNMSQFSAFIFANLGDLNWAGFYLREQGETMRLGPFQGELACTQIPLGKGVCGVAAEQGKTLRVDNVNEFDGHIACDSRSQAEIVVPLLSVAGELIGVFDIDSPSLARFSATDRAGIERLVAAFLELTDFSRFTIDLGCT